MLDLDKLRTDTAAETDGAWFTLGNGMRVKIARINEHTIGDAIRAELGPANVKLAREGKLADALYSRVRRIAIGMTSVRDWEPVQYQGREFSFSPDNLGTLMRDDALHDIRDGIAAIAESEAAFRESFLKDAEKN